jgi:hypothetical protein
MTRLTATVAVSSRCPQLAPRAVPRHTAVACANGGPDQAEQHTREAERHRRGSHRVLWGTAQDAERTAHFEPFGRLSRINTRDFAGADINKVKAMVETGNVEWDVVQLSRSTVKNLMKKGDYFEEIDYDLVDMRTSIRRSPRSPRWRSC